MDAIEATLASFHAGQDPPKMPAPKHEPETHRTREMIDKMLSGGESNCLTAGQKELLKASRKTLTDMLYEPLDGDLAIVHAPTRCSEESKRRVIDAIKSVVRKCTSSCCDVQ